MSDVEEFGADKYRVCGNCGSTSIAVQPKPICIECRSTNIKIMQWEWQASDESDPDAETYNNNLW